LLIACVIGIENGIVTHDHDSIGGDGAVELERAHAELERELETRQRVLRPQPTRAAMSLQIEALHVLAPCRRWRHRSRSAKRREHERTCSANASHSCFARDCADRHGQ
jgi:hypothetical protein